MTTSSEDLPPPYVPPAPSPTQVPVAVATAVPRWIVVYAMLGKPLLWLLHRVANGIMLFEQRGKEGFDGLLIAFVTWALASLLVVAVVYAGGAHAWAKPFGRPRLLRFGLGCDIASSILLTALLILVIGAALGAPSSESGQPGGWGDIAASIAAILWVSSFVTDVIAWRRLGRVQWSASSR